MVTSVQGLIENYLHRNKDKTIIFHKKGYRTNSITGRQLLNKIKKTMFFFKSKNIKKKDKIILLGSSSIEWVAVYFASILSGVTVVPLDTLTDKSLLKRIQKQVKAKAVFHDEGMASLDKKNYHLDDLDTILKNIKKVKIQKTKADPNDILEIVYTSGTTGRPKGVILTHGNVSAAVHSALAATPLKFKFKMLNLLPLSHVFGHIQGLFLLLSQGHQIFFIDSLRPRKIIDFIRNKRINGALLVPGMLSNLKTELRGKSPAWNLGSQFRIVGVGGAALDIKLEKWWKRRLVFILKGYGLTETASVVSTNKLIPSKTGSVGKVAEGVAIKLGKDNEILIKGKNVTPGYYKDKDKTKNSFDLGWLKTGDIGETKNNYLYIKERKKDVIVTEAGLNVYPIDIEMIVDKIREVKENCVIEKDGKIHAVLILNGEGKVVDIVGRANKKLLAHQKILSYSIWPYKEFPKTPTGKIKKFLVAEQIAKEKKKVYNYKKHLYSVISDVLKPHQRIKAGGKLSDWGMDSLKGMQLISVLEREFGVEIDEAKLTSTTRVSQLERLLHESVVHKVRFRKWPLHLVSRMVRFLGQNLLTYPLIRVFTRTDYHGLDLVPEGPVIFAGNHQSTWDSPVMLRRIKRRVAIAASSEYVFGIGTKGFLKVYRKLTGFLAALFFNAYPFGESIGTDASFELTGEFVDRGYSILILPEGQRSRDGKIKTFKQGIGYLALQMAVPIVPIKVEGLFDVLPVHRIIPRFGKSTVKIGKPILPEMLEGLSYIRVTQLVEKKVREL